MFKSMQGRALFFALVVGALAFSQSLFAQSNTDEKSASTQRVEMLKQQRVQQLKVEFEQLFARMSGSPVIKRGNIETMASPPSVVVGRIGVDGSLETMCLSDPLAAAKFLTGETPTVNLQALKAKE